MKLVSVSEFFLDVEQLDGAQSASGQLASTYIFIFQAPAVHALFPGCFPFFLPRIDNFDPSVA